MMRTAKIVAVAALVVCVAAPSYAAVAYVVPGGTAGNQSYSSVLGMDFDVNSPIVVNDLGVFDDNSDGISANGRLTVELWSRTGNTGGATATGALLASQVFTSASPGALNGGSLFKALGAPLALGPGQYSIVAYGFTGDDQNGNFGLPGAGLWTTDDGGGALSFVNFSRYGGIPGTTIGDRLDTLWPNRYAAGTFSFTAVPEPSSIALFAGLGVAGIFALRRRRRK